MRHCYDHGSHESHCRGACETEDSRLCFMAVWLWDSGIFWDLGYVTAGRARGQEASS